MEKKSFLLLLFAALLALAGCGPAAVQSAAGPAPTPTDCGCSVEGPNRAAPTAGFGSPAGPALSGEGAGGGSGGGEGSAGAGQWQTFTSAAGGFSFEYPAAYATPPYSACAARTNPDLPAGASALILLGSRTGLTVAPAPASLDAALAAFRADLARTDFRFDAARERVVAGLPARTLSYHSGGTNRYGESTFFIKDGLLYRVDTVGDPPEGGPSACDLPDLNLTELDAYEHMLESFTVK